MPYVLLFLKHHLLSRYVFWQWLWMKSRVWLSQLESEWSIVFDMAESCISIWYGFFQHLWGVTVSIYHSRWRHCLHIPFHRGCWCIKLKNEEHGLSGAIVTPDHGHWCQKCTCTWGAHKTTDYCKAESFYNGYLSTFHLLSNILTFFFILLAHYLVLFSAG